MVKNIGVFKSLLQLKHEEITFLIGVMLEIEVDENFPACDVDVVGLFDLLSFFPLTFFFLIFTLIL